MDLKVRSGRHSRVAEPVGEMEGDERDNGRVHTHTLPYSLHSQPDRRVRSLHFLLVLLDLVAR